MDHKEIMTLIIGYTCVGVFVATAIITLLSLVGLLRINPDVKKKLFAILIVEVVSIGVALWKDFITLDKKPLEAKIETLVAETNRDDKRPPDRVEPTPSANIKPRVYFHIKREAQRSQAHRAAAALSAKGDIEVPGIQKLDVGPSSTELRFFRRSEEAEAVKIGNNLKALGIEATVRYVPGFEDSKSIRPRHYELWVSE